MVAKLRTASLMRDMRPLLPAGEALALSDAAVTEAFTRVFTAFVQLLPGEQ